MLGCFALFYCPCIAAEVDEQKAKKVKSAYLLNFIRFTQWPSNVFADDTSPIVLGVIGEDPLGEILDRTVAGYVILGRPVKVLRIRSIASKKLDDPEYQHHLKLAHQQLSYCHLLFIADSEATSLAAILNCDNVKDILTVSDIPRFAERGGMFGLVIRKGRIVFNANRSVIDNSNLKVSSKVLRLAKIVKTEAY